MILEQGQGAEKVSHQVEFEKTDQAPVDSADDDKGQSNVVKPF